VTRPSSIRPSLQEIEAHAFQAMLARGERPFAFAPADAVISSAETEALRWAHQYHEDRKSQGAFYTPPELATELVQLALAEWGWPRPRVLDPACGTGIFLEAVAREGGLAYGIDVDAGAVRLARALGAAAGPMPTVVEGDFLASRSREMRFDVVVGNPPYVRYHALPSARVSELARRFETAQGQFDLFAVMLERSLDVLRDGGVLGFVLPSLFLRGPRYASLRRHLLDAGHFLHVVEHGDGRFHRVQAPTCHVVFRKAPSPSGHHVRMVAAGTEQEMWVAEDLWRAHPDAAFVSASGAEAWARSSQRLGDVATVRRGYPVGRRSPAWRTRNGPGCVPCIAGEDIAPYEVRRRRWLDVSQGGWPEELGRAGAQRVVVRETGSELTATVVPADVHVTRTLYSIQSDVNPHALAALLNSRIAQDWFDRCVRPATGIFPKIRIGQLRGFPLPAVGGPQWRRLAALGETAPTDPEARAAIEALVAGLYESRGC
jgi:methylase of polypeptide subunit release factors